MTKTRNELLTNQLNHGDISSGVMTSLGAVGGVSSVVKFGHCPSAGAVITDVWELGDTIPLYVFPADGGETITIESSNAGDNQTITVQGLDENGLEVSIDVALSGATPVTVSGLFTAVNRAFNSDSTVTAGDIFIKGLSSGNTFAYIDAREQQTTQCIYAVPSNKYAVARNLSTSINKGGNQDTVAIATMLVQQSGGVFRTQVRYGLQKRGTSNISSDLVLPPVYGPSSRIKVAIEPDAADVDISAEFSVQLIDVDVANSLRYQ